MDGPRIAPWLLVAAGLVGGCSAEPRLAVLCPQSGEAEAWGRELDSGVQLAVAETRSSGLLPADLRIYRVDTGSSPRLAASELRRLALQHRVPLVVGGVTGDEATALRAVAEERRVVCLSPSAPADGGGRHSRYFFDLAGSDRIEGRAAARHLAVSLGVRRIVVYTDDSSLTRVLEYEFRRQFEQGYGGEIGTTIHLGDVRWTARSADALHAHDPQAVYIVGQRASILGVLGHLAGRGFRPIRCTTSAFYSANLLATCDGLAEGVLFPLPEHDGDTFRRRAGGLEAAYLRRYGVGPDLYAVRGYDAARLALRALVAGGLRTDEVRGFLCDELQRPGGSFAASGVPLATELARQPVMHTVRQGRTVPCGRFDEPMPRVLREPLGAWRPRAAVARHVAPPPSR